MWTLAGLVWWNSRKDAYSHCIHYVFTTVMNVYEDCIICSICICTRIFLLRHTDTKTHSPFTPTYSYHSPLPAQRLLTFVSPPLSLPSLHPPSPTLFLSFALCCYKAFPWLAVINLPSLGAGSWLRASKRSYKAKTAIQKQSRFSCFQSIT